MKMSDFHDEEKLPGGKWVISFCSGVDLGESFVVGGGGIVLVKMSRFNILTHKCIFQ